MAKPTVYLDTSIISAFWFRGADNNLRARRGSTRDWWEWERRHFEVWTSAVVTAELSAGSFSGQTDCVKMARRCRYLPVDGRVRELHALLMESGVVPQNKGGYAAHLAICCVHGVDYLLTWNYAHMANPAVQARLSDVCSRLGFRAPFMVSPEMIPQVRLGQDRSK